MARTDWEGQGDWLTTRSRLTDAFEIGKTQYNTSTAIAKGNYDTQLAEMRLQHTNANPKFYANLAARGLNGGGGFGGQNVLLREQAQGNAEKHLLENWYTNQLQLNDQRNALGRQFDTGMKDTDITKLYRQYAMNEAFK